MLARCVLFFVILTAGIAQAGNTTCKTTTLDWYTQSVGETPCRTYERLQQICTPNYQVGNFAPTAPGDKCSTSFRGCCCNSVAWSLPMLCMNCQYGTGSGVFGDPGINAEIGGYGAYLNNCGSSRNKTLPEDVQKGVCRQNIKLPAFIYDIFWTDGPWYYQHTKGEAVLDISSGTNDTGLCPTPSPSSTASTVISTGTTTPISQPTSSGSSVPVGAIAGGVAGGVVLLAAAVLLGFCISRRRKDRRGVIDLTEEGKPLSAVFEPDNLPPGAIAQPVVISPSTPRRNKIGSIDPSPPAKAEIYQPQPLLSTDAGSSSHTTGRHEDSEILTNEFGLGRSASGRLPPSYRAKG
ncbi:unnamed protein product [Rhizoctonia solani]|uniref:Uncharacterized protein n=1 Tax=Rhizoctonia solani TaxID=456999 RepID=A0A8H3BYY4_9AGAM|nr:unnamed protein product [Rhizoctonia solani]